MRIPLYHSIRKNQACEILNCYIGIILIDITCINCPESDQIYCHNIQKSGGFTLKFKAFSLGQTKLGYKLSVEGAELISILIYQNVLIYSFVIGAFYLNEPVSVK